jgi:hypothetical protein
MSYAETFSISDQEQPILKVKLNNDFGDLILGLENEGLKDNEVFLENFKGISVVASAQNTMLYLNPNGSNSSLTIYYRNDESGPETLSLNFELGGEAARISLFNEKNNAIFEYDSNVYLQSMAGYKGKITLGDLDVVKDTLEGKVINKVTIDFDVAPDSQSKYLAHEKLILVRVDNEGSNVFLTDFTIEGETHFGGKLDGGIYSFNITRFFYQLLNNSSYTNDLYLMPSGAAINANRTILSENIKLTIHYSEL